MACSNGRMKCSGITNDLTKARNVKKVILKTKLAVSEKSIFEIRGGFMRFVLETKMSEIIICRKFFSIHALPSLSPKRVSSFIYCIVKKCH